MKLVIKRIITLFILFIFIVNYIASRKLYTIKTKEEEIKINTENPYFAFVSGFIESVDKDAKQWIECLPQNWGKNIPQKLQNKGFADIEKKFNKWKDTLQNIIKNIGPVVKNICDVKNSVVTIIKAILGREKLFLLFLEKVNKTKFRNKWSLADWIKNKSNFMHNEVKENINKAWGLIDKMTKSSLDTIKTDLILWRNKIVEWYKSEFFQRILTVINCTISARHFQENVISTLRKGITKISSIIKADSSGKIKLNVVISDLIVGLICVWKVYKKAVDYFLKGNALTERVPKWYLYGQGSGQMFLAICNSENIQDH
jgi:hypothetical protein